MFLPSYDQAAELDREVCRAAQSDDTGDLTFVELLEYVLKAFPLCHCKC